MDHSSHSHSKSSHGAADHHGGHGGEHHDGHHGEHHGGVGKYLAVFAALCGLTLVSFFIANSSLKETAPLTAWAAMMAVSGAKALLVMLFFMHLIWEANWKYVLTIPAGMMSLFLVFMLVPDVGQRTWYYHPTRWLYATEFADQAHSGEEHGADHAAEGAGGAGHDEAAHSGDAAHGAPADAPRDENAKKADH